MMYSRRSCALLGFLEDRSLVKAIVDLEEFKQYAKRCLDSFTTIAPAFVENVNYMSPTFLQALEKSQDTLNDLFIEEVKRTDKITSFTGVYLSNEVSMCCMQHWEKGNIVVLFYAFSRAGRLLGYYAFFPGRETITYVDATVCQHEGITDEAGKRDLLLMMVRSCATIEYFKLYAKMETVYVAAGKKATSPTGEKTKNQTAVNITMLDSRWFTTIIREEGFGVRGHLRLQPKKKNGEWTKELIWIKAFEKKGYRREATIKNS